MSNRRGSTLISLLVSIAILAIALAAAASAFISASKLTKHASDYTTISNFTQSAMEHTIAQPFSSIRTSSVSKGLPKLPNTACRVDVKETEPLLKQVTVTCTWTEGKAPRSMRLSTLVAGGRR